MADFYQAQKSVVTYPSLVLKQISIIQGIVTHELRDSTKIIKTPIGEQIIESEDTRYGFLQSVEFFGSMLSTYFDNDTKILFDAFVKFYDLELIDAIKIDGFKKLIMETFNIKEENIKTELKDAKLRKELLTFLLNEKCKKARILVRQLINCFKDNDFLTSSLYIEGEADDGLTAVVGEEETEDRGVEEVNEVEI